jgi:hypothetical protein
MPTKDELIRARRQELLALGYKPGIVELSLEWAVGNADGMAGYALKGDLEDQRLSRETLTVRFLPQYLKDCEKWIIGIGHERGEVPPQA